MNKRAIQAAVIFLFLERSKTIEIWDELVDAIESGETVFDIDGYNSWYFELDGVPYQIVTVIENEIEYVEIVPGRGKESDYQWLSPSPCERSSLPPAEFILAAVDRGDLEPLLDWVG